MGINYSIDAEARIVRLEYVGETTPEEFAATMTAIFRSTPYRPGFGFLSDRRETEPPTTEYVQRTAAFAQAHHAQLAGGRWATVVSSAVNYGLGRMAQSLLESRGDPVLLRVFEDVGEAERWLRGTDEGQSNDLISMLR